MLPNGGVPPPITGSGRDYGLMFDFLGDGRYFTRLTYYKSEQLNDASIIPDGLTVSTSGSLGGDNLLNILGALRDAGKLTQAQYDAQKFNWLGTPSQESAMLVVWHQFPVNTIEEAKTREMRLGASGSGSTPAFFARVSLLFAHPVHVSFVLAAYYGAVC